MGIYVGRDNLIALKDKVSQKTKNELKGLSGEIAVGDLLAKLLPEDTYVIAHPQIGKADPDFLVISPQYGFRLVEVKNWSIDYIQNVATNGLMQVANSTQNPYGQVKSHTEELKGYLLSNYPKLGDPFRLIGGVVLHYGFTKEQFIKKFHTDKWEKNNAKGFFAFHFFQDDLNKNINDLLDKATKYPSNNLINRLDKKYIELIVRNMKISDKPPSEIEIELLQKTRELDEKTSEILKITQELKNVRQDNPYNNDSGYKMPQKNRYTKIVGIAAILLFLVGCYCFMNKDIKDPNTATDMIPTTTNTTTSTAPKTATINTVSDSEIKETPTNSTDEQGESASKQIEITAKVLKFSYDKKSGTKFLILLNGNEQLDAVIFSDKQGIPYIKVEETYTFEGKMQEYNQKPELNVFSVKE